MSLVYLLKKVLTLLLQLTLTYLASSGGIGLVISLYNWKCNIHCQDMFHLLVPYSIVLFFNLFVSCEFASCSHFIVMPGGKSHLQILIAAIEALYGTMSVGA